MAEKVPLTMPGSSHPSEDEKPLRVRRGRVDSVDLFEIKDSELDLLERGSPADLQFNFGIFVLSTAISCLGALVTATFNSKVAENVFLIITVAGLLLGAYLMISWWRNRTSLHEVCKKIRGRIPPDPKPRPQAGEKLGEE